MSKKKEKETRKVKISKEAREKAAVQTYVPDVETIMDAVREKFGLRKWKRRSKPEKKCCTIEGYEKNYVVLPTEWVGGHLIKRDEIVSALPPEIKKSEDMRKLAISLGLAKEIHIPSLGKDPEKWDISKVPLPVLNWLVNVVFQDFLSASFVPKAE